MHRFILRQHYRLFVPLRFIFISLCGTGKRKYPDIVCRHIESSEWDWFTFTEFFCKIEEAYAKGRVPLL